MESYRSMEQIIREQYPEYIKRYLKTGKVPIQLVLDDARKQGVSPDKIARAEERAMTTGELYLTYDGAKRIYNDLTTGLSEEHKKVIGSFDQVRDADLIVNYLFTVHPTIRKKVENSSDNLYRVVLKLGSKKKRSSTVNERDSQEHQSGEAVYNSLISPSLQEAITQVPRDKFTGDEEYQRRLRVLIQKKAERDAFPHFKKDQSEAFAYLDKRLQEENYENLSDAYKELKDTYQKYVEFTPPGANTQFKDPETGEKGVLPSLHQKIALYHLIKEQKFGVFDGCGTGKTAIGALAVPLIEQELRKEGKDLSRIVIVGPNSAKKAWKKGLEGKVDERYLAEAQDIAVINGEKKDESMLNELSKKKWIVLNYEQLTTKVNGSDELFVDALIRNGVDYVIFDESHQIKGHDTETKGGRPTRSAAARKLAKNAKYLCLLTGSPIPDSMEDYAVLYHLLNPKDCPDPEKFKEIYQNNPRILYTLFNNKTIRRTSEDINENLQWEENNELVEVSPEQERIYQHLLEVRTKNWLTQARKALLDPRLVDPAILRRTGLLGKVGYEHAKKYHKLEELLVSRDGPIEKGENFVIFSSMFREGVTRKEHEELRNRYITLGVEEEFDKAKDLERKILAKSLSENISSVNELKRKFSSRKTEKDKSDKEFNHALNSLVNKGYILLNGDNFAINVSGEGSVQKYLTHYKNLGFDVPVSERIERKLKEKHGKDFSIGIIDGTVGDIEERERIVDNLGKNLVGILCTTDTGGESLDFTHASQAYFLDRDYKPKTEEQALARLVRKGQKNKVKINHLLANRADEILQEYVERKRIIIKTAVDGHHITEEEQSLLEDKDGTQFGSELILAAGLGGKSINTLEAKINDLDAFQVKKRTTGTSKESGRLMVPSNITEAQELMRWIGQDPVNCWKDPEFVDLYVRLLPNLAVPVVHRARITDLLRRSKEGQVTFPTRVISEGSGPSILYEAYQDLRPLIEKHGFVVPKVVDRDISRAMITAGKNPNKVLGDMTGRKSKLKPGEFDMVDNSSISLLPNGDDVKLSLLEANRILRPQGLLELTVENKRFHDGTLIPEEERTGTLERPSFYSGLEGLGFEVLSEKNQGFALSKSFFKALKEKHGAHFAEAYERKLTNTYFILARKEANPIETNAENFWFRYPVGTEKDEMKQEVRDPSESRSIINVSTRRKGGRPRKNREEVVNPEREVKVDKSGNVISVKKLGGK